MVKYCKEIQALTRERRKSVAWTFLRYFVIPRCVEEVSIETHEGNKRLNIEWNFNTVGWKMIGLMNCYEEEFAGSIDNKLFDSINHH
jgi:ribosomal protein S19